MTSSKRTSRRSRTSITPITRSSSGLRRAKTAPTRRRGGSSSAWVPTGLGSRSPTPTRPPIRRWRSCSRSSAPPRGEIVVVSDSNVRVTPSYLDPLVAELARPGVAVVSSVVAGTGEQTLGAALENLQLGALVAPGVVAAAWLAGRAITIGKSMAMWREALHSVGGFSRVAHLLSEDHMLGKAFAQRGLQGACLARRGPEPQRRLLAQANGRAPHPLGQAPPRHRARRVRVRANALVPSSSTTLACALVPTRTLAAAFLVAAFSQTVGASSRHACFAALRLAGTGCPSNSCARTSSFSAGSGVREPTCELARSRLRACSRLGNRSRRAECLDPRSRHGARMTHSLTTNHSLPR